MDEQITQRLSRASAHRVEAGGEEIASAIRAAAREIYGYVSRRLGAVERSVEDQIDHVEWYGGEAFSQ
ncbi:hypothetical protein [Streptomyces sp. NPDC056672]|uniref:hypothetical protein n=1 Tax=Streptomyces sp. NPDC056672 TaxID=3345906 RepID=UPI00368E3CE7